MVCGPQMLEMLSRKLWKVGAHSGIPILREEGIECNCRRALGSATTEPQVDVWPSGQNPEQSSSECPINEKIFFIQRLVGLPQKRDQSLRREISLKVRFGVGVLRDVMLCEISPG